MTPRRVRSAGPLPLPFRTDRYARREKPPGVIRGSESRGSSGSQPPRTHGRGALTCCNVARKTDDCAVYVLSDLSITKKKYDEMGIACARALPEAGNAQDWPEIAS